MIRTLTLAAAAAALLAAPAAAQSIRVSTAGKSTAQVHADVVKAAKSVCRQATIGATFPHEEMSRCVKWTVAQTIAQARSPELAALASATAQR